MISIESPNGPAHALPVLRQAESDERSQGVSLPEKTEKEQRHEAYLDSLEVPSAAKVEQITKVQERKEGEVEARHSLEMNDPALAAVSTKSSEEGTKAREAAAGAIQRVYRGHRARRELDGLGLSPSARWVEAIKDAQYKRLTTPHAREQPEVTQASPERPKSSDAHKRWQQMSQIARHAHGELPQTDLSQQDRKDKHAWQGKYMDLPYWLEMVDLKHRYGSNLRAYHAEWKKADTHENFFYWLDQGEGRNVVVSTVSRERLEREQVRYLSREERMQYLVVVDELGKLRWKKNGELIDTSIEYRDSVNGIVPQNDPTKTFRQDEIEALSQKYGNTNLNEQHASDSSSISSGEKSEEELRYPDPANLQDAKGAKKVVHVTPAVILNRLLRKSVKKNTWIFVVDTSMNLHVGIKQSGSFQHSSFIQGTRIYAAGLIKIKRGQLRSLSPLSGHYRPPTSAFRNFVKTLKEKNVDMSRVSISKSYAVLVGLEAYIGGKERVKHAEVKVAHGFEHVVHPEKARERKEKEKDTSQSARREEELLKEQQESQRMSAALRRAREKMSMDDASSTKHGSHFHLGHTESRTRTGISTETGNLGKEGLDQKT